MVHGSWVWVSVSQFRGLEFMCRARDLALGNALLRAVHERFRVSGFVGSEISRFIFRVSGFGFRAPSFGVLSRGIEFDLAVRDSLLIPGSGFKTSGYGRGSKEGSYVRRIDFCITQLTA